MEEVFYIALTFAMAAGIAYFAIPTIIKVALLKNLCDEPNKRSSTTKTIPTLGGIAIYIGFLLSLVIGSNGYPFMEVKYVIAAITIMFFIGLKDDILDISPRKKLAGQIISSLIIITLANIRFTNLHGFCGVQEVPYIVSIVLTLFVMIVIINAFNLIDGIDGLAAGVAILTSFAFGIFFYLEGHIEYCIMAVALIGTLVSFFRFNVFGKKNKIFMGDTGSLIVGTVMGVMLISFNEMNVGINSPLALKNAPAVSTAILVIPLIDTLRVFTLRLLNGQSPFHADRKHLHHRLLDLGFNHIQSTIILLTANLVFIILAVSLRDIGTTTAVTIIIPLAVFISMVPSYLLHKKRRKEGDFRTYPD
jgi:UDP-N-acetylmuramyl pentapeptide phosphotransferase/UDP-N-acetylglucosamine-1-phosphate transferase